MSLNKRVNQLLAGKGENYIFPFFWQHGEEEAVLRDYMQKIKEANIGAVCVESRPHPDFVGEKWWKDMDVILDEAKKLGMKVWILDDSHFPTGYAAGKMETAGKELCHQYLDYNVLEAWGPRKRMEINVEAYAKPQPLPPWMPPMPGEPKRKLCDDSVFRVIACPVEEKGRIGAPVDMTGQVKDGRLIFDVPEGYWKIYVVYLTRDARGRNNYINFLDEKSCRVLVDAVYEPHYEKYGALFGTVIAGFFSDEPPIGNTPGYTRGDLIGKPDMSLAWSGEMQAMMEKEYGKGWEPETPFLWNQGSDGQRTARIRTAYMNAVSRLVSRCFSNQLGKWCGDHGVEYIGHMLEDCDSSANLGPGMGHFFRGLSGQHMAGIDNIGGQVLPGGQNVRRHEPDMCQDSAGFYHYMLGRMGASMAAIDAKKKGRCMCENFGAYGWRAGVSLEKYLMDHFLTRGVNHYVPHAFSPKAFPDPDCPPHFYAHGENPQLKAFGALMAYTNRICHLISGGVGEAPVALLYHGESQWAGEYESNILACRSLTEGQISFLIIPADVFAETEGAAVFSEKEKTLNINGNLCRALVISGCQYITKAAAEFVIKAVNAGFKVVFTGRLPEGISDTDKEESKALTEKLSGCRVVPVEKLAEEFAEDSWRTVSLEKPEKYLTAYHYRNGQDLYLILNENAAQGISQWITLPAGGTEIAAYDAWENKIRPVQVREVPDEGKGGKVQVYVKLEPLEMLVLLCGTEGGILGADLEKSGRRADLEEECGKKLPDDGDREKIYKLDKFTVSRCESRDYPNFASAEEADLENGMALRHPEFSGIYRYETTVSLENAKANEEAAHKEKAHMAEYKAWLCLTEVYDSAEVFVNGQSAGIRVARPYRFDITEALGDGENRIAIEVATTLERKAATIGAGDRGMGALTPLSPTGLIGDVTLKIQATEET